MENKANKEKRTRSPNYPAFGLPTAIEKVTTLYNNQHTHSAPRDVAVISMGYNSLNGASATAISAVMKYGLLERIGDEVKISDRAMCILHPQSAEEKAEALRAAAMEPPLFRELAEKFPGRLPADDVLKNYLIRNGFAPQAVSAVILAYRDTFEFADREVGGYDSVVSAPKESENLPMTTQQAIYSTSTKPMILQGNQRQLAHYTFEDGGTISILVSGDVPTTKALKMADVLLKLKKEELAAAVEVEDNDND